MFDEQRYLTNGVKVDIPVVYIMLMWSLIDDLKETSEVDYLQVFEFNVENKKQKLVHSQEVPIYREEYEFDLLELLNFKIYVIDSGEYSTMMLSSEY